MKRREFAGYAMAIGATAAVVAASPIKRKKSIVEMIKRDAGVHTSRTAGIYFTYMDGQDDVDMDVPDDLVVETANGENTNSRLWKY